MTRTSHYRWAGTFAGLFVAALGIAGTVAAHDGRSGGPGPRGLDFAALDSDGDGAVSRAEMIAAGTARLAAVDTDGNGRLDRAEIIAMMPEKGATMNLFGPDRAAMMADRMIARFGAGETGDVAIQAMVERQVEEMFARYDADDSGTVTAEEHAAGMGRHAARGDRDGHGPRGRGRDHRRD